MSNNRVILPLPLNNYAKYATDTSKSNQPHTHKILFFSKKCLPRSSGVIKTHSPRHWCVWRSKKILRLNETISYPRGLIILIHCFAVCVWIGSVTGLADVTSRDVHALMYGILLYHTQSNLRYKTKYVRAYSDRNYPVASQSIP